MKPRKKKFTVGSKWTIEQQGGECWSWAIQILAKTCVGNEERWIAARIGIDPGDGLIVLDAYGMAVGLQEECSWDEPRRVIKRNYFIESILADD